jgi:hypothetical protein
MKHKQNHKSDESNGEKKANVTKLPLMEMYAVLGLELQKTILEKLKEIEDSLEIFAHQKGAELKAERKRNKAA